MAHIDAIIYDEASPDVRAAFDREVAARGQPTNMKRTLLRSPVAHEAYMQWYPLWKEVVSLLGLREAVIYAHAISTTNNCLLCSVFFRKAISDLGESADSLQLNDDETLISELGFAAARQQDGIDPKLWERLRRRFDDVQLVNLIAFAGMMVATNLFNNLVQVEVDRHLTPYLPAARKPAA